jgi:hypothetical protein
VLSVSEVVPKNSQKGALNAPRQGLSSRLAAGARDDWQTPGSVLTRVNRLGGIAGGGCRWITLDPCSAPDNPTGATSWVWPPDGDGLALNWLDHMRGVIGGPGLVFVNPPYSQMKAWAAKIAHEARQGCEIRRPSRGRDDEGRRAATARRRLHGAAPLAGAPPDIMDDPRFREPPDPKAVERRRHLLARMAGNIAGAFAGVPEQRDLFGAPGAGFPGLPSPEWVAERSVSIARAILAELEREPAA